MLALRSGADSAPTLLGGLTFNYFVVTNCGKPKTKKKKNSSLLLLLFHLFTYFSFLSGLITSALVKKLDGLQEQLAKALVERAVDILDQNAVSR